MARGGNYKQPDPEWGTDKDGFGPGGEKQPTATIVVATILQRPGTEGAEYVIRLPDGQEASVWDGQDEYWDIANAIDTAFPSA